MVGLDEPSERRKKFRDTVYGLTATWGFVGCLPLLTWMLFSLLDWMDGTGGLTEWTAGVAFSQCPWTWGMTFPLYFGALIFVAVFRVASGD